jgi:hypothetical protein
MGCGRPFALTIRWSEANSRPPDSACSSSESPAQMAGRGWIAGQSPCRRLARTSASSPGMVARTQWSTHRIGSTASAARVNLDGSASTSLVGANVRLGFRPAEIPVAFQSWGQSGDMNRPKQMRKAKTGRSRMNSTWWRNSFAARQMHWKFLSSGILETRQGWDLRSPGSKTGTGPFSTSCERQCPQAPSELSAVCHICVILWASLGLLKFTRLHLSSCSSGAFLVEKRGKGKKGGHLGSGRHLSLRMQGLATWVWPDVLLAPRRADGTAPTFLLLILVQGVRCCVERGARGQDEQR